MGALSRTLREDGRKNTDLTTNIIYIFFCMSNFTQFHPTLSQYHAGDYTLKIAELELKRFNERAEELRQKETQGAAVASEARKQFRAFVAKQVRMPSPCALRDWRPNVLCRNDFCTCAFMCC